MQEFSLEYGPSTISYHRSGHGPGQLVCFHGYGETAGAFNFLDEYAGDLYTIYAIDLPAHGNTRWESGKDLLASDLRDIVAAITGPGKGPLTLMGFSLGGRMALALYQLIPERVEKLVLLAPDGLKVNRWYWLATQTRAGNRFFRFTMEHPGWFFGMLKLFNRMGLINASIFKFVNYYISNREVRMQLYTRWTALRKIRPDLKQIRSSIREQHTAVSLLYGRHDRIILSSVGVRFCRGLKEFCRIRVIESGHQVLHEKHAKDIIAELGG